MTRNGADKHINQIPESSSLYDIKKCALQNCSSYSKNTVNMIEKYYPKETTKT